MNWRSWFEELDVSDDIEEVHSIYASIRDCDSGYGYTVNRTSNNGLKIESPGGEVCNMTSNEAKEFLEYLDGLPVCNGLGVEGARELHKEMGKND